jgi:hypothetical protein
VIDGAHTKPAFNSAAAKSAAEGTPAPVNITPKGAPPGVELYAMGRKAQPGQPTYSQGAVKTVIDPVQVPNYQDLAAQAQAKGAQRLGQQMRSGKPLPVEHVEMVKAPNGQEYHFTMYPKAANGQVNFSNVHPTLPPNLQRPAVNGIPKLNNTPSSRTIITPAPLNNGPLKALPPGPPKGAELVDQMYDVMDGVKTTAGSQKPFDQPLNHAAKVSNDDGNAVYIPPAKGGRIGVFETASPDDLYRKINAYEQAVKQGVDPASLGLDIQGIRKTPEGNYQIAMPHVEGKPLASVQGELTPAQQQEIGLLAAKEFKRVLDKGLVLNDLHGNNLMVQFDKAGKPTGVRIIDPEFMPANKTVNQQLDAAYKKDGMSGFMNEAAKRYPVLETINNLMKGNAAPMSPSLSPGKPPTVDPKLRSSALPGVAPTLGVLGNTQTGGGADKQAAMSTNNFAGKSVYGPAFPAKPGTPQTVAPAGASRPVGISLPVAAKPMATPASAVIASKPVIGPALPGNASTLKVDSSVSLKGIGTNPLPASTSGVLALNNAKLGTTTASSPTLTALANNLGTRATPALPSAAIAAKPAPAVPPAASFKPVTSPPVLPPSIVAAKPVIAPPVALPTVSAAAPALPAVSSAPVRTLDSSVTIKPLTSSPLPSSSLDLSKLSSSNLNLSKLNPGQLSALSTLTSGGSLRLM